MIRAPHWKTARLAVLALAATVTAALSAFAQSPQGHLQADGDTQKTVVFATIRGSINPATSSYLRSSIQMAERVGAEALVVELDTPGGLVSSVRQMAQAIDEAHVPVVVYVTPAGASATSAGALLALAANTVAMSPGTNLGAAHPVDSGGKDIGGAMGEKAVNDTAAFARGLAELRGRDPKLAEQIVSKSVSLSAQEARDKGLADFLASDRKEFMAKLDGRQWVKGSMRRVIRSQAAPGAPAVQVLESEMTLGQKILHLLADPNIATLLISLGMLCLYVEITTPGITIPGVLGGILLLVGFMSFQLLPIRLGGLILILMGVGFLFAELFVSTHGALAFGGALSFVLGLVWIIDPGSTSLAVNPAIWVSAGLLLGGAALGLAWVASRGKKLSRETLEKIGGAGKLGLNGYIGRVESVEASGVHGKASIRGETWDFESAEPVAIGDSVRVERTRGFIAEVRPESAKENSAEFKDLTGRKH